MLRSYTTLINFRREPLIRLRTQSNDGCCGMKRAFSKRYLVQRVALVVVLLRQAVSRIRADERAAGVCVAYRVNVGSWWSVRRRCNNTKQRLLETDCFFGKISYCIFPLTRARYGPENIFVQAGVQEGAGPGRGHQSISEKRILSSILKGKIGEKVNSRPHVYDMSQLC